MLGAEPRSVFSVSLERIVSIEYEERIVCVKPGIAADEFRYLGEYDSTPGLTLDKDRAIVDHRDTVELVVRVGVRKTDVEPAPASTELSDKELADILFECTCIASPDGLLTRRASTEPAAERHV